MPQASKYVPAPFKKHADDPYGDPAEVFASRLMEVAAGVGLQNAFYPSAADVDNGSPNILDHPDHTFFMVGPRAAALTVYDRASGFDATLGAPNNWIPRRIYSHYPLGENYGATADLPAEPAPPAWYQGGSADLWNYSSGNYLRWEFQLDPNTTYTFSFYYKKLGSADWSLYVDAGSGASAYDLYQDPDGLTAALGSWARKVITFTTGSSGLVYIYLGGRSSWGGAEKEKGLRLAFPQLELGSAATAWQPPRFWAYHAFPAPIAIDETIDGTTNYASLLALALPGSAVAYKLDGRPDWTGVTSSSYARRNWYTPVTKSATNTGVYTPSFSTGSTTQPMLYMLEPRPTNGIGVHYFSIVNYGSYTVPFKAVLAGVWVKHRLIGGMLIADSGSTSGPGHNKAVAWRTVDLGAPSFRLIIAGTAAGPSFEVSGAVGAQWYSGANGQIYDPVQSSTTVKPRGSIGVLVLDLNQNEDLFIDAIGNVQGLALAFYQAGAYKVPLVLADFLEPPAPADDGSIWPRWGMVLPHDRMGYVVAGVGPLALHYYIANGPNFHTPTGWGIQNSGYPASPYYEIALGVRMSDRLGLFAAHAARSDSTAANRGRIANVYVARNAAFSANRGDSWLSQDGQRYVYVWRQTSAEAHLLFVKP